MLYSEIIAVSFETVEEVGALGGQVPYSNLLACDDVH